MVVKLTYQGNLLAVRLKLDRFGSTETCLHGEDVLERLAKISPDCYPSSLFFGLAHCES